MHTRERFFIDGRWVAPAGADRLTVTGPRDGEPLGQVPLGTARDIDAAVHAARDAFQTWRQLLAGSRADYLDEIAARLESRAQELAELIAAEVGMPLKLARRIQVDLPIANLRSCARIARDHAFSRQVGNSQVVQEPVGVVAAITPWNYPLHQIVLKIAPALAAGCTVVLKPSEVTPFNAFALADAVEASGLPAGVFNVVTAAGPDVARRLVSHPDVDKISFTGSTAVGKSIAALAAESVKRVTLELGGKSAAVVLDDADLAAAVRHTVNSCFLNSGQTCTALTRLLVPSQLYKEASESAATLANAMAVGDPFDPATRLGPLTTAIQRERVIAAVRRGLADGAHLLAGGEDRPAGAPTGGFYVRPTVFGNVTPDMALAQEEIFGPVLCVIPYADEDDAVAIANGTVYGLAAAVWSADQERARAFARRLRAGQIDINGGHFNPDAPFGGFGQSGYGREAGVYGLEDYLEYKSLQFKA